MKRNLHLYICTSEIRAFTYFCKGVVWLHCVTPNKLEMCLLWSSMRSVLVLSYHKTGSKATNRHCAATGGGAAVASPGLVEPLVLAVPRSGSREADFGLITLAAPGWANTHCSFTEWKPVRGGEREFPFCFRFKLSARLKEWETTVFGFYLCGRYCQTAAV